MRKVLEEFALLLVVFLSPLAIILLIPGDGGISLLPILPVLTLGGAATTYLSLKNGLCFEKWISSSPKITFPLVAILLVGIIFGEMQLVISIKLPELAIPRPAASTPDEIEQALRDEFSEFH